jgi:hypothetical protein
MGGNTDLNRIIVLKAEIREATSASTQVCNAHTPSRLLFRRSSIVSIGNPSVAVRTFTGLILPSVTAPPYSWVDLNLRRTNSS